ncbi:MAG: hypothetical protein WCJ64_19350, partial [Rhodospirillaceae bacterium]
AMPSKIMIIRHGEKPTVKRQAPFGVTADGGQDFESLLVRGWQRAGALAVLFDPARGSLQDPNLAVPTLIYASEPDQDDGDGHKGSKSQRPLQTIQPLAARLGLAPDLQFEKGEEKELAQDVMKQAGVVLISWQHESILDIVKHLTKGAPVTGKIPDDWPGDRFDIVWVLTPPTSQLPSWQFVQVPQDLLAGDRNSVIS